MSQPTFWEAGCNTEDMDFRAMQVYVKNPIFFYLLVLWPWENYLISLSLSCLTGKYG